MAIILADLELDKESIAAGLLHDVVEDTVMTEEELTEGVRPEVSLIVSGVTKLAQLKYSADKVEEQAENLRKMFLAMAKDIRVILVKLAGPSAQHADRTVLVAGDAEEKARETMDIYAPIAHRLGISKIKVELDDLSLKYLEPDAYYELAEGQHEAEQRQEFVDAIVKEVTRHIHQAGIEADVNGRIALFQHLKKMLNQHKTLDQIYDLFAVRIIVESVKDCYAAARCHP